MCGFLTYFGENADVKKLAKFSSKIQYRGPDNTKDVLVNEKLFMSFHRLAIIDVTELLNIDPRQFAAN